MKTPVILFEIKIDGEPRLFAHVNKTGKYANLMPWVQHNGNSVSYPVNKREVFVDWLNKNGYYVEHRI